MKAILLAVLLTVWSVYGPVFNKTCDRITQHGYPCETHTVQTFDGYSLTLFRIPHSHNLINQLDANKSAVLLMHGIMSSSDGFVLNGPEDDLCFMLSDNGYDVWLGNSRGNDYSQKHVSKSAGFPPFWAFSWHEIGTIDVPTKIDYILKTTGQRKLHYVGHSQGGTTFFVMLSTHPAYNAKIKTSHLLAPTVYMEHIRSPLSNLLSSISLDKPSWIADFIGASKLTDGKEFLDPILPFVCRAKWAQELCASIVFSVAGGSSPYTNRTLLSAFYETHPAACSARQLLHYIQERDSKQFRLYDYGRAKNLAIYGQADPPNYQLENVNLDVPVAVYFSENDEWVTVKDIHRLAAELGSKMTSHHVKYSKFNHLDFLLAYNTKEVINDCVLDQINQYEGKPFTGNKCGSFLEGNLNL